MKIPFYDWRTWARALIKGVALLLIFDALFIALRPFDALQPLSLYGSLLPYRTRIILPVGGDQSNQLMPLETLLRAHEINRPKAQDEYRVIVLGDSGINGWGNDDSHTVSGLLSASGYSIGSKRLKAYNLAFVGPSEMRDLVIADAALDYEPDMVIAFVDLPGFQNIYPHQLIELNQARMVRLTARFGLTDINARTYTHADDTWWQQSIFVERGAIYRWLRFQSMSLQTYQTGAVKQIAPNEPIPAQPAMRADDPLFTPMPNPAWRSLIALRDLAGLPTLIVNEPILIMPGSTVNYNALYGREVYDQYRSVLHTFCMSNKLWCLDIWNALSPNDFTDSPLHHTDSGNAVIAQAVLKALHEHEAF